MLSSLSQHSATGIYYSCRNFALKNSILSRLERDGHFCIFLFKNFFNEGRIGGN